MAGLAEEHVVSFTDMGFSRDKVVSNLTAVLSAVKYLTVTDFCSQEEKLSRKQRESCYVQFCEHQGIIVHSGSLTPFPVFRRAFAGLESVPTGNLGQLSMNMLERQC